MNEELIDAAVLGDEGQKFIKSALGKKMLDMAVEEVIAAQEALEKIEPMNQVKITELQNRAWRARSFEQWLFELISRGEAALAAFRQQQQEG